MKPVVTITIVVNSSNQQMTDCQLDPEVTITEIFDFAQDQFHLEGDIQQWKCYSKQRDAFYDDHNCILGNQFRKDTLTFFTTQEVQILKLFLGDQLLQTQQPLQQQSVFTQYQYCGSFNRQANIQLQPGRATFKEQLHCRIHTNEVISQICVANHNCSERRLCPSCCYNNEHNQIGKEETPLIETFTEKLFTKINLYLQQIQNIVQLQSQLKQIQSFLQNELTKFQASFHEALNLYTSAFEKMKSYAQQLIQRPIYQNENSKLEEIISLLTGDELEKQEYINKVNYQTIKSHLKLFNSTVNDFIYQLSNLKFITILSSQCQKKGLILFTLIHQIQATLTLSYIYLIIQGKYLVNFVKDTKIELTFEIISGNGIINSKNEFKDSLSLRKIFETISSLYKLNSTYEDWTCYSKQEQKLLVNQQQSLQWHSIQNKDHLRIETLPKCLNVKFEIETEQGFEKMEEKFKLADTFTFLIETVMHSLKIDKDLNNVNLYYFNKEYSRKDVSGKLQINSILKNNCTVHGKIIPIDVMITLIIMPSKETVDMTFGQNTTLKEVYEYIQENHMQAKKIFQVQGDFSNWTCYSQNRNRYYNDLNFKIGKNMKEDILTIYPTKLLNQQG